MKLKRYIWNLLITFDQFVNTLFKGDPDETISSRCGRANLKTEAKTKECTVCRFLCSLLNIFEADHCHKAIEKDKLKTRRK